jgi:hypothetical protein
LDDWETRKCFAPATILVPDRAVHKLVTVQTELFRIIIIIIIIIIISATKKQQQQQYRGYYVCCVRWMLLCQVMGNVKKGGVINVFTVEQQKERRGKEGTVGKTDDFLYSLLTNYFFCLFLLVPLVFNN